MLNDHARQLHICHATRKAQQLYTSFIKLEWHCKTIALQRPGLSNVLAMFDAVAVDAAREKNQMFEMPLNFET